MSEIKTIDDLIDFCAQEHSAWKNCEEVQNDSRYKEYCEGYARACKKLHEKAKELKANMAVHSPPLDMIRWGHGHGHVLPRADGVKARCSGTIGCSYCQREAAELADSMERQPVASNFGVVNIGRIKPRGEK